MKKRYIVQIAIVLALLMTVQPPAKILADSKPLYVKEMRVSWSMDDAESAKRWLRSNGYEVVDENINDGAKEGYSYVGYKTTTNKDEAVTDVSTMSMDGGYKPFNYRAMMEKQSKDTKQMAAEMLSACNDFRTNLAAGSPSAKSGKKVLDSFRVEEDNNRPLGDYLLDESRRVDDLYEILLKANSLVISLIYNQLLLGTADYKTDNWMKRLSDNGPEKITPENEDDEDYKYSAKAKNLKNAIQIFADNYKKASKKSEASLKVKLNDMSEDELDKEAERLANDGEVKDDSDDALYVATYKKLATYKYGDTNLGDFFLKMAEKGSNNQDLYPLIKTLTEGQYAMFRIEGICNMVMSSDNTEENAKLVNEELPELQSNLIDAAGGTKPSLWVGTNQEIWNQEVSMTNEAYRQATASGNYDLLTKEEGLQEDLRIAMEFLAIIGGSALALSLFVSVGLCISMGMTVGLSSLATLVLMMWGSLATTIGSCIAGSSALGPLAIAIVAAACILVCGIIYGIKALIDLYDYYHPEYTTIPTNMCSYEDSKYITYEVVKDHMGFAADVNNWNGKKWVAIYTTKDKNAGSPLMVDDAGKVFKVQKGGNYSTPSGYAPMRNFGEKVAANLNEHDYKDNNNGLFLFYRTELSIRSTKENVAVSVDGNPTSETYLSDLRIESASKQEIATELLRKKGYIVIQHNLTLGQDDTYTFIGYKTTKKESEAIRDIRVAYANDRSEFQWGDYIYGNCGTVNNVTMYYSKYEGTGTPIQGNLQLTDKLSNAKKGYEPVNLFSGGQAFDFALYDEESYSEWSRHSYIFFCPSEQYTSGTKYISGINFVSGSSTVKGHSLGSYIDELGLTAAYPNFTDGVYMNQGVEHWDHPITRLCYTTTYNPYRAIYDIGVYRAEEKAENIAGSMTKDGVGYSACDIYTQGTYSYYDNWIDGNYRIMRKDHAYISKNRAGGGSYKTAGTKLEHTRDYRTVDTNEKVPFGQSQEYTSPMQAMYVAGISKSKKPIKAGDFTISTSSWTEDGYKPVTLMTDIYGTHAINLSHSYDGTKYYMYLKKEDHPVKEKKTYIESIEVVSDRTENYSVDTCMMKLLAKGGDEIIDFNLASHYGGLVSDANLPTEVFHITPGAHFDEDEDGYEKEASYMRVTRTSDKNEAIGSIVIYTSMGVPPDTFEKDEITYTRCGDSFNGISYIYTAKVGNPITKVSLSTQALVNGKDPVPRVMKTLKKVYNFDYENWNPSGLGLSEILRKLQDYTMQYQFENYGGYTKPWYIQSDSPNIKKQIYMEKVQVGVGTTRKDALNELYDAGCTNYVEMDMNDYAKKSKVCLIGYKRTKSKSKAIRDLIIGQSFSDEWTLAAPSKYLIAMNKQRYTLADPDSLNASTDGKRLFLYYSMDASIGAPLVKLYGAAAGGRHYSDGSEHVLDGWGKVADLEYGVGGSSYQQYGSSSIYLYVRRSDNSIKTIDANASGLASAFTKPELIAMIVMPCILLMIALYGVNISKKRKMNGGESHETNK